jgi:hypothetical protein
VGVCKRPANGARSSPAQARPCTSPSALRHSLLARRPRDPGVVCPLSARNTPYVAQDLINDPPSAPSAAIPAEGLEGD